ncbi:glycerol dehydrogenase [Lachnospiraceae bacterium PF1-22]|uniref:glycerol dehydrogenase n=1 Tax=Ohessyouella blattaphilus TaxID=2949333 RepID=UPI003E258C71
MSKILICPTKYQQGAGELKRVGEYAKNYGKKVLVLITNSGYKRIGKEVEASLSEHGVEVVIDYFKGECSRSEIERLKAIMEEQGLDMVIGIGGGKILDTAKAVAYYCKRPVMICPTIASTDAPCSALSVIYSDKGVFEEYLFLPTNPNMVLVDTEVVAKSPVRLTVAGMGDALATYFEARAVAKSDSTTCAGGSGTLAALALAKLCYETLLTEGVKAKLALESGALTKSVEAIIEANTLLSGIGFESGGLAGAHAIHNGFTALPETHQAYHGEKVAFGTIVQLILENADEDELGEVIEFCIEIGLPVTLKELGIRTINDSKLKEVAKIACADSDTLGNLSFKVSEEDVVAAIKAADACGRYFLGETK